MACKGYLSTEKKVVDLPSGSTLKNTRDKFGRPMRQQKIVDEDGYELDATAPISNYSKGCNISIAFTYATGKEVEAAKRMSGSAIDSTKNVAGDALQRIRDKPRGV
eukprot:13719155-Ditylum_brightwellii.AAC.1